MQELSDVCIKLRSKLHDTLSDTLDGEKKVVRSKLRDKGWTQEEINSYDHILEWGRLISSWASPQEVIDILLIKYVLLLSTFILDYNNQRAITILNEIVMRIISEQFSILTKAGLIDELESVYSRLTIEKWNTVVGAIAKSRFLDYKFIKEEFRNAALAKLRILTPNKQIMDRELQLLYNEEYEFSMKNDEKSPLSAAIALCEEVYSQAKLDS
jgi:rRNA-processing protein FCF1